MKNIKHLFKKNILMSFIIFILMSFSFLIFNLAYNSVNTLNLDKSSIPSAYRYYKKYVDTNNISSYDKQFYPSFLLDDEKIQLIEGDGSIKWLPSISVGYDQNWNNGFFKTITEKDILINNVTGLIDKISFHVNTNSDHYKNSYLQKLANASISEKGKIEKFYFNLLNEVFLNSNSIFQKNIIYSINQSFIFDKNENDPKYSSVVECALDLLNPNNMKTLTNRYWVDKSTDSNNIIEINRWFNNNKDTNFENLVSAPHLEKWYKSDNKVHGYNGQIGSFIHYIDHGSDSSQDNNNIYYFTSLYQSWTCNYISQIYKNNFYSLGFEMNNYNDYLYNDSPNDILYKGQYVSELYDNIYYKISSNSSLSSIFLDYYFSYLGNKNNLIIEHRSELLTYDLQKNYNYKLINGVDVGYNNELKIIEKSNNLNTNNWNYNQIMISPGFFYKHNLKIGDTLTIGSIDLIISGVATDSYNIYPTTYNDEYISDSSKDAIVYCSQSLMKKIVKNNNDNFSNNDYIFFDAKNNLNKKMESFFKDLYNIKNNADVINILNNKSKNFNSLTSVYYGYKMLDYVVIVLKSIMYFFSAIFFIISVSIILVVLKEIIDSQRIVIGILKANGYKFLEITKNYYGFLLLIIIPSLLFGFGLSIIVLNFLMTSLSKFFSIFIPPHTSYIFFVIGMMLFIVITLLFFTIMLNKKININPLRVINKFSTLKNLKNRINLKVKKTNLFISFLRSSRLKLLGLGTVSFISSSIVLICSIIVVFFYNYNNNKFSFYNFNSQTNYNNLVVGNPLNKISTYNWDSYKNSMTKDEMLKNGIIPYKFSYKDRNSKESEIFSITDLQQNLKNINQTDIVGYLWQLMIQGIMFNNQKNISISYLSYIANNIVGGSTDEEGSEAYINYRNICENISYLLATYLPKALDMESISYEEYPTPSTRGVNTLSDAYVDVWKSIVNQIVDNKIPANSKIVWKENNKNAANFNLGFNSIPCSKNNDLLTNLQLENGNYVYGQKEKSKNGFDISDLNKLKVSNQSLNKDKNDLYVYASTHYQKSSSFKPILQLKYKINQLQFLNNNSNWINFSDYKNDRDAQWFFEDEQGKINNLYNTDREFSAYSLSSKNNVNFYDKNNKVILNVNDIILKIKQSDISSWDKYDISDFQKNSESMRNLLDEKRSPILYTTHNQKEGVKLITSKDGFYYIRPFSYAFSGDDTTFSADAGATWYDAAIQTSKHKLISLIKENEIEKTVNLKILGFVKDYSSDNFYVDQTSLNQFLGVSDNNSWFNVSTSQQKLPESQIWDYPLTNKNGNASFKYSNNIKSLNKSATYIGMEKQIIQKIIDVSISIGSIIFLMIIIIIAVSITFISRNFINAFKSNILILKAIGYSKIKINTIFFNLLMVPILISSILGCSIFISLLNVIAKNLVEKLGLIIPIGSGVTLFPIIVFGMILITLCTFSIMEKIINKIKVTEITED